MMLDLGATKCLPMSRGEGSTSTSPEVVQKKKRVAVGKNWCFTYHLIDGEDEMSRMSMMSSIFRDAGCEYVMGYELGKKGETPHIQGMIESRKGMRPIETFGKSLGATLHWEKRIASRTANIDYCMKECRSFLCSFRVNPPLPVIELYGWQLECRAKFEGPTPDRLIYWYWSSAASRGKTSMAKWLNRQTGVVIASGDAKDMKFMVKNFIDINEGLWPTTLVMNVPRDQRRVSYMAMEELKDGLFCSEKYESGGLEMAPPKIFVFANWAPETDNVRMSADKWDIVCVDDDTEVPSDMQEVSPASCSIVT